MRSCAQVLPGDDLAIMGCMLLRDIADFHLCQLPSPDSAVQSRESCAASQYLWEALVVLDRVAAASPHNPQVHALALRLFGSCGAVMPALRCLLEGLRVKHIQVCAPPGNSCLDSCLNSCLNSCLYLCLVPRVSCRRHTRKSRTVYSCALWR